MEVDLAWLEDVCALTETRHFSRAAEKRDLSQPAFSRRIKLMETWLGVQLFRRDTHRIELTPAGEHWSAVAEDLLRRAYQGREQAREIASGDKVTLRFASTHALTITFFPGFVSNIEDQAQFSAGISLVTDNMVGCEQKMLQGQAQFLLCHHHPSASVLLKPNYFRSIEVGSDKLMPVCAAAPNSSSPLFALPGSIDAPVPHLSYGGSSGFGRILAAHRALDAPSAWLTTAFTAHVAIALVIMAKAGRGVAWLPDSLISHDITAGKLVRAGGMEWDVDVTIRLYRPRARQNPAAEAFWSVVSRMYMGGKT